jgi:phage terminase large subunit-like protein
VFPEDDGTFAVLPCCFVPEDSVRQRALKDHRPYPEWVRLGHLTPTEGNVVDYDAVRAVLREWGERFTIKRIAFDPWNATDLVNRLQQQDGFECVAIRQGFASLSAPTKALEAAILSKKLKHDGHPVLSDHIANAAIESDAAGNVKLSKKASTERIDAAIALVCAVDLLNRDSHAPPPVEADVFVLGGV